MASVVVDRDGVAGWEVARPATAGAVGGVDVVGFHDSAAAGLDMAVVPCRAVTVVVQGGEEPLVVEDAGGRRSVGALVAGLAPGWVRVRAAGLAMDPEVRLAWRRIVASGGLARVGDLAAACGWSRNRLWSRFRAQIGLTPKRAATLVRLDRATQRPGEAAATVAATCGYVDQSHLHRDVHDFAGCTPAALAGDDLWAVDTAAWGG